METSEKILQNIRFDALLPPEMAHKAAGIGVVKAKMGWRNLLMLSILAGAFIALGSVFYTVVTTGGDIRAPFGITKLAGGFVFSLGLILVVVAGAELFTGNNLIIMAWAEKKITSRDVLRNWAIVYFGNFVGSTATALFMFFTKQYLMSNGAVGLNILTIANYKCGLAFFQAGLLGIFCNALVCLAVWLCFSCHTTTDKILAIIFPISAFVASGFEHCIANMYFVPAGILLKEFSGQELWALIGKSPADFGNLTLTGFFLKNLLPVTLGNIFGGSVLIGLPYWFVYIRKPRVSPFVTEV